jgi:hypothetical protein
MARSWCRPLAEERESAGTTRPSPRRRPKPKIGGKQVHGNGQPVELAVLLKCRQPCIKLPFANEGSMGFARRHWRVGARRTEMVESKRRTTAAAEGCQHKYFHKACKPHVIC